MKRIVAGAALAVWMTLPLGAAADCMKDRDGNVFCGAGLCVRDMQGQVYCAPSRFGSVMRTSTGQMVCARGRCVTTLDGDVICSVVDGGGAMKMSDGTPRCQDRCERATAEMCERTPGSP